MVRKLLLILLLILLPCSLWSADYYVSQSGGATKTGTYEDPYSWATINWTTVADGDTLYVIGHLNATGFSVGGSGTTSSYLTISGYDTSSIITTTYNKASTLSWSEPDEFGAYALSSVSSMGSISGYTEWTTASGPINWTEITKQTKVPDGDWVAGSAYYDADNSILYWKPLGGTLTGKTLSVGSSNSFQIDGKSWVKISDIKIYGAPVYLGYNTHSEYIYLYNVVIDALNGSFCVKSEDADNVRVSYSTLKNAQNGLWNSRGDDYFTIDHNTFTDFEGHQDSHCIGLYDGGQNWTIEHNDLSYANTGITMYGEEINNVVIRYNMIHHMEHDRATGGTGYQRGYGIGSEGNVSEGQTRTGNYIYNNVVYSCTGSSSNAMSAYGIHFKGTDANNFIYNNTVYDCSPNYFVSNITIGGVTQPTAGVFKNNLSLSPNNTANQKHIVLNGNAEGYANFTINNNLYYPNADVTYFSTAADTTLNFADWKTQLGAYSITGADANSLVDDPVVISTSNLALQSTSPAINAGVDVSLTTDYLGNPIVGLPDIGAYEFASGGKWSGVTIKGATFK